MSLLTQPVTSKDHSRGDLRAPIQLVEYGDFQCPYSAETHLRLKALCEELEDELVFVFRHFPLSQVHEYSFLGAMSAEAAGVQGKFWEMHDRLFENQELIGDGVVQLAQDLGLELDEFEDNLENEILSRRVKNDFMSALRSGVSGTPAFFLNERQYGGPLDADVLRDFAAVSRARLAGN